MLGAKAEGLKAEVKILQSVQSCLRADRMRNNDTFAESNVEELVNTVYRYKMNCWNHVPHITSDRIPRTTAE